MRYWFWITLVAFGCSQQGYEFRPEAAKRGFEQKGLAVVSDDSGSVRGENKEKPLPDAAALQRKIIYTADAELVVEDFSSVPSQVEALAERFDAYVASSNVTGSPGRPRSGQWTIRVPAERYDEFLRAVEELGEVHRLSSDSQDVTEEYYDVQARIRNKKQTEQRLLKQLEEATGELKEILEVERELDRVREKIEQMEGRMRVLDNLTTLTTVNLSITEIKDYVPELAPTYGTRVRRAFSASINTLVSTAKSLSIAVIAALPWLGVLLVPLGLLVLALRARRNRRRRAAEA